MRSAWGGLPICVEEPQSVAAEAYRMLRTNLQFAGVNGELQVLMVTSADSGEGKTTTACNLAAVMAQAGRRVLLLDADLRRPSVHHSFGLSNRTGLSSLLIREVEVVDAVQEALVGLDVIPSGPVPPNPAEMLGSVRMQELLIELKGRYEVVIVDTPPLLPVTDAQVLAAAADGVLLVLRSGRVHRDHARRAKTLLEQAGANVVGAVLNGQRQRGARYRSYR